jgi:hypothetical protein
LVSVISHPSLPDLRRVRAFSGLPGIGSLT